MQYTDTGMQFIVRYPVEMRNASATDDRVLQSLSDLLLQGRAEIPIPPQAADPRLQAAV